VLGGPLNSLLNQPFSLSSNIANIGSFQIGNFASAGSNLLGLAGGGLMSAPEDAGADAAGAAAEGAEGAAVGEVGAVGAVGGGAPVAAGVGGATTIGAMSVPPSWAAGTTLVSSTAPATMAGAGWTTAAPAATTGGFYPGVPGMASAARNSAGFGAPRYGVKPIVMPKPAIAG
jgi:hypothetical protein